MGISWSGKDVTKMSVIGKIKVAPVDYGIVKFPAKTYNVVEITGDGDIYITDQWNKKGVPQIIHKKMVEKYIPKNNLKESISYINSIDLDTSIIWFDGKQKIYGSRSDGEMTYNPALKHFSIDTHGIKYPGKPIIVVNKQTENKMHFTLTKIDYDGSHEDIYGWNYVCKNNKGTYTLLVVND